MTVIAYKAGVMAADSAVWSDGVLVGHHPKISRVNGCLVASCGLAANKNVLVRWAKEGDFDATPYWGSTKSEEMAGLVVLPDGVVLHWSSDPDPDRDIASPFFAIGCGGPVALGAMAAGASAAEAVRIATMFAAYCAGEVQVERLKPKPAAGFAIKKRVTWPAIVAQRERRKVSKAEVRKANGE